MVITYANLLISFVLGAYLGVPGAAMPVSVSVASVPEAVSTDQSAEIKAEIPDVPFYSQFKDIQSPEWRKKACGVASLAMIINFYRPETVSTQTLLKEGIAAGAYLNNAGWTHQGLALLAEHYGLNGASYDLSGLSMDSAFARFAEFLKTGPVIASVYYTFDPTSPIPHLVVVNGIENNTVYYNDPAAKTGGEKISTADFITGWKKRFIVIRP